MIIKVASVVALCGWFHATAVSAQRGAYAACEDCRVEVINVGELSDRGNPMEFGDQVYLFGFGPMSLAVASVVDPGKIGIFDRKGQFLAVFGRYGAGPEEFRSVLAVGMAGSDSALIVDVGNRRISVVGSELRVVREIRLPGALPAIAVFNDGRYVMSGSLPNESGAGFAFHLFDRDGRYVKSFGGPSGPWASGSDNGPLRRIVRAAGGNSFWAVSPQSYRLELWSSDGKMISAFEEERPWMANTRKGNPYETEPGSNVVGIAISDDVVWTVSHVADAGWHRGMAPKRADAPPEQAELDALFDTVIEAIDIKNGALISASRDRRYLWPVAGENLVYTLVPTELGEPAVQLWTPRLVPPR